MARSMWTGSISFGLANVPVKMYTATSEKSVRFKQVNSKTGACVRQKRVDDVTGKEVKYEDIVKGFEITPDVYVTVTPEELEDLAPEKTKQIALERFVEPEAIPTMAFDKPYYLSPNTGGGRAFKLLLDVLSETGKVGVGRMVIRTNEKLVALYPAGDVIVCHTLVRADEINTTDGLYTEPLGEISDAERDMATKLVEALAGPFDYKSYKDEYREKVLALVQAKADGLELPASEEPAPQPTSDILAALEASLEAVVGGARAKTAA